MASDSFLLKTAIIPLSLVSMLLLTACAENDENNDAINTSVKREIISSGATVGTIGEINSKNEEYCNKIINSNIDKSTLAREEMKYFGMCLLINDDYQEAKDLFKKLPYQSNDFGTGLLYGIASAYENNHSTSKDFYDLHNKVVDMKNKDDRVSYWSNLDLKLRDKAYPINGIVKNKNVCKSNEVKADQLSNAELQYYVNCLILKDAPDKAKGVILSQNKQNDKYFNVILDYSSAYMNSATTYDEWSAISDRILEVQGESKDQKIRSEMHDLIMKISNTRTQPLLDKGRQKFNEKYYNPSIGMTKEQVEKSEWGKPKDINKTTTKYGVSEQWVYHGGKYVYFENGVVTSIQE